MTSFTDLELDPKVLQAVADAGYETPTPIQAQAIPPALAGRDVLGIAQTGTGKTASFVLPMITMLGKGRARARMPRSLVLCPTRELAAQVAENFETYAKHGKLTMALLIGGTSFKDQDRLIDRGVDVLIATPGRLLDHFERGKLMLTGVQIMVIDEADRMLDMGFIPDIERIFKLTPFTRQTLFFSATMAPEITRITQEFLSNPVRVEIARQATASETIEQHVCMIKPPRKDAADKNKRDALRMLIEAEGDKLTNGIIFCNRKRDVDIVAKSLKKHGYDAEPIHGDLDQSVRTRVLTGFRDGELRLLVASDVAARGLDIPSVSHVFNFNVPIHSEDYVHRIGRTGRAGRQGKSITLCVPAEEKFLEGVEKLIGKEITRLENPLKDSGHPSARTDKKTEKNDKPRAQKSRPDKPQEDRSRAVQTKSDKPVPPRNSDRKSDQPRRVPQRNQGGSQNRVVGMGDHMPAFLTREFRFVENTIIAEDEGETVATETEAPAKKKPAARKRSTKKPAKMVADSPVDEAPKQAEVEQIAVEPVAETADPAPALEEEKPKKRRTRSSSKKKPEPEAVASTEAATVEEKPAKKPRARRKAAPKVKEAVSVESAETQTPEKPAKKPRVRQSSKPVETAEIVPPDAG